MGEQASQEEPAGEHELSKEEFTTMLTTAPGQRENTLRQAYVQRSLSQLIAADAQWGTTYASELLEGLSKLIRAHAYETYSWELRSALLRVWGRVSSLQDSPLIHSWLDVRWSELGRLFSLEMPQQWYKLAFTLLLTTPLDIPPEHLVSIVSYYSQRFEALLRHLMQASRTQKMVISFFTMLAEHNYPRTVQLLDMLLNEATASQELMDALLTSAHLDRRSIENLLENHCQVLLTQHALSPAFLNLIRHYFINFDVGNLNTEHTTALLQRLLQRNTRSALRLPADLRPYVEGWYAISELVAQPAKAKQWLRKRGWSVHMMPQLTPDSQIKLTARLVPLLVEFVTSEADICLVTHNLGHVLIGASIGPLGPELILLEQLTTRASVTYRRERPPTRILPYLKAVFEEAHFLPSPEKENFIQRCLADSFYVFDASVLSMIESNAHLWPQQSQSEWHSLLARSGRVGVATTPEEGSYANPTSQLYGQPTSALPPEALGNVNYPVALVNGQPVSFAHFRNMCRMKPIYAEYERYVQQRTASQERPSAKAKEQAGAINAQRLQQEALDDLVDDLLIQEEVAGLVRQNSHLALNFDANRQLSPLLQDFKVFCGPRYPALLSNYQLNDTDVAMVLRVFILRGLFEMYLQNQRKSLSHWLKERRRRATITTNSG